MGKLIAFAAAIAATMPSVALAENASEPDRVDVAFEALAEGRTAEAVAELSKAHEAESNDPAVLINLGTAYARQGRNEEARAMFEAAMSSSERYELELADGSWVDSRKAARMALANLDSESASALR
ncbi:MAG TPA: tetratricopeptide repeat protein [Sphingomonadaceae bacterium]|nr:tetratricopeptide repeat protein [Sphingomonadaceae bacterium]